MLNDAFLEMTHDTVRNGTYWNGYDCVRELKSASERDSMNYGWRQMEWIGFYLEYLIKTSVNDIIVPSQRRFDTSDGGYMNVDFFDMRDSVHIDAKCHNISAGHIIIANDINAVRQCLDSDGAIGFYVVLGDGVPDDDGNFKQFVDRLKGHPSRYVVTTQRHFARVRKVGFTLRQARLYVIRSLDEEGVVIQRQGRNSNGKPRPNKIALDLNVLVPDYVEVFD